MRKALQLLQLSLSMALVLAIAANAQTQLEEVEFAADSSTILEKEYRVVLEGNVHLTSADMELKGDNIVINFKRPENDGDETEVDNAQGRGNIWARNGDMEIVSSSVDYDYQGQTAVFSGDAVITQGGNKVRSSEVRLHLATGVYELVGGVRGKLSDF